MDRPEPALARLIDRVMLAQADRAALEIRGGGTKDFYGGAPTGEPLPVAGLAGISSYEPTELVVTVRAGTPLAELEAALDERGQCLPFEPPRFAPGGTVGGMVAAGLSGPARASVGAVRDHVLGLTLLNGRGEVVETPGGWSDFVRQNPGFFAPVSAGAGRVQKRVAAPSAAPKGVAKLSFKDKHRLSVLEALAKKLTGEIAALEGRLADTTLYARDRAAFDAATTRLVAARAELEIGRAHV